MRRRISPSAPSVPVTTLVPAVRAIIAAADPLLPIINVRTLEDIVSLETASRVVQLRVLGAFAAVAFLLAAIGIHGLLAFTVSARSREIGVRIALGAKARDIIGMVIGRSAMLAVLGVVIGAALAYAAGRSMQALLFGVDPANPQCLRRRHRSRSTHDTRRQPASRVARGASRSHRRDARRLRFIHGFTDSRIDARPDAGRGAAVGRCRSRGRKREAFERELLFRPLTRRRGRCPSGLVSV